MPPVLYIFKVALWDLSLGGKDGTTCKSINVAHHFNSMQDKNYMITWKYAEKVFDKIQHPFMIKTQHSGYGGNILWHNKAVYDKPTTNNILNDEKLKAFDLRSKTRQGCPHAPLLFNTVVEILARANRKEKRN